MSLRWAEFIIQRQQFSISPMRTRPLCQTLASKRLSRARQIKPHVQNPLIRTTTRTSRCLPSRYRVPHCTHTNSVIKLTDEFLRETIYDNILKIYLAATQRDTRLRFNRDPPPARHRRNQPRRFTTNHNTMTDHTNQKVLEKTVRRCRERNIVVPTFAQLKDPEKIPAAIRSRLGSVALNDINPVNLFRITWKNEPKTTGGGL